jgi:hypothetical protein
MEIECEFKNIKWDDGVRYTCHVFSTSITKPNTTIKDFIGKHKSGMNINDVEAIWFIHSKINFFPRGLHRIFPKLKFLEIWNSGFESNF